MITTIVIVLYVLLTGLAFLGIILYGARPSKSLSWLLVIVFMPFFGVLFYVLFGINRRKFKIFKLKQTKYRKLYDTEHMDQCGEATLNNFNSKKRARLARLLSNNNQFLPYSDNTIEVLQDGKTTFDTIFKAISEAKEFVHIQYYILEKGKLMDSLLDILEKKTKEGVEVRMLYDAIGSFAWKRKSIKRFKKIGVKIYPSMPLRFGSIIFSFNYRNHRKIVIVDGKIGFTGGFNLTDKYIEPSSKMGIWHDTHVKLEGPVVESLHKVFIKDYYFASKEDILLDSKYIPKLEVKGDSTVQIVASGPDSDYAAIMQQYIMLINLAEEKICIGNPYFIPSASVLNSLIIASLSGVKVQILLPEQSDSVMARLSMRSYFEEMLRAGMEIYLYPDTFLHSKIVLIDGEIMSIGSGNFDNRSFDHNFETNVLIYDSTKTQKLQESFEQNIQEANNLELESFENRSSKEKLFEGLARFFSPLL
jgi:cardiolipin synthase